MTKRTDSKAQREIINYNRLKAMAGYMDMIDKRLEAIADDMGLIVALNVADEETKNKLINSIREGMKTEAVDGKND